MFVFCFNDCIPRDHSDEIADSCLENSLREYHKLTQLFPGKVNGIITSCTPSSVVINRNSSLSDCMGRITDRDLKRYAYSVFLKFPIESHYVVDNEGELIENNFYINVNGINYDALYPFVVFSNQGVLFSLAVHDDICKNQLVISNDTGKVADVENLHGNDTNTKYLENIIRKTLYDSADNLDKLRTTIGENRISERFLKKFENFPMNVQQAVVNHFASAKKRNCPTPFSADNDLIKDVTPTKETTVRIFELRIFEPVACRVYFYETGSCVYLGSIENKPNKKTQDSHINTVRNIIRELVTL